MENSPYTAPIYGCCYQSSPQALNFKTETRPLCTWKSLSCNTVHEVYEGL